jgi:hypothetical protein
MFPAGDPEIIELGSVPGWWCSICPACRYRPIYAAVRVGALRRAAYRRARPCALVAAAQREAGQHRGADRRRDQPAVRTRDRAARPARVAAAPRHGAARARRQPARTPPPVTRGRYPGLVTYPRGQMIPTSLRTAEPGVGAAAPAGSGREPGLGPEPVRGRLPRGHNALSPGRRQSARYARLASDSRITVAELLPVVSPVAATSTSATLTCITGRSGPINSVEPSRCRPRRVGDRAAWPPRHDVTYCDSSSSRLARAGPPLRSPVRSAWLSAMAAPEGSIWHAAFPASRGRARFT